MIKGPAYIGCQTLVLERVVVSSAREHLLSFLERLPERSMASTLLDELKTLATGVERSKIEDVVGASWVALAVGEGPQEKVGEKRGVGWEDRGILKG